MITGIHAVVFSQEAEKVRGFFADVLGLPSADAGGGWLIFALPPAELAVHPAGGGRHELYLMCDDIHATLAVLRDRGVTVTREPTDQRWGLLAAISLPDGTEFGIYQPAHPMPPRPLPATNVPSRHLGSGLFLRPAKLNGMPRQTCKHLPFGGDDKVQPGRLVRYCWHTRGSDAMAAQRESPKPEERNVDAW